MEIVHTIVELSVATLVAILVFWGLGSVTYHLLKVRTGTVLIYPAIGVLGLASVMVLSFIVMMVGT